MWPRGYSTQRVCVPLPQIILCFALRHGCFEVFLEQDPLLYVDFYLMPLLSFYFILMRLCPSLFKELSFSCVYFNLSKNS